MISRERILWLLSCFFGAFLLIGAIWPRLQVDNEKRTTTALPNTPDSVVRVAILNGCGDVGVAARMRKKAQTLGFDVIDEGNADSFNYLHSIVIDRLGNVKKAKQVANMLGIPNFIQQISNDDYRLEDIRIIVGKDYKRLRLLE